MNKFDKVRDEFNTIYSYVGGFYDLPKDKILHCNKHDCVEARYIIVNILCDKHSDEDISRALGLSKSLVNKIRNAVHYSVEKRKLLPTIIDIKRTLYPNTH